MTIFVVQNCWTFWPKRRKISRSACKCDGQPGLLSSWPLRSAKFSFVLWVVSLDTMALFLPQGRPELCVQLYLFAKQGSPFFFLVRCSLLLQPMRIIPPVKSSKSISPPILNGLSSDPCLSGSIGPETVAHSPSFGLGRVFFFFFPLNFQKVNPKRPKWYRPNRDRVDQTFGSCLFPGKPLAVMVPACGSEGFSLGGYSSV